jgi:hypothetical protein
MAIHIYFVSALDLQDSAPRSFAMGENTRLFMALDCATLERRALAQPVLYLFHKEEKEIRAAPWGRRRFRTKVSWI